MNWKGNYSCDGGSLRIFSKDFAVSFMNRVGDGEFEVEVNFTDGFNYRKGEFIGAFEARQVGQIHIASYDCGYDSIYTFPLGRYAVYAHDNGDMTIVYWDRYGI